MAARFERAPARRAWTSSRRGIAGRARRSGGSLRRDGGRAIVFGAELGRSLTDCYDLKLCGYLHGSAVRTRHGAPVPNEQPQSNRRPRASLRRQPAGRREGDRFVGTTRAQPIGLVRFKGVWISAGRGGSNAPRLAGLGPAAAERSASAGSPSASLATDDDGAQPPSP